MLASNNILSLIGAAMGMSRAALIQPAFQPKVRGRDRKPGPVRPAGSKLARAAEKGRIGKKHHGMCPQMRGLSPMSATRCGR